MWNYGSANGYQWALRRSVRELSIAIDHANDAGDEALVVRLGDLASQLERLRHDSEIRDLRRRKARSPKRKRTEEPMVGQTSIHDDQG